MRLFLLLVFILVCSFMVSCVEQDPNSDRSGENELKSLEVHRELNKSEMKYEETYYVPIYSDIYLDRANQSSLLAATLSIRNTSASDSLFVSILDYYNTGGDLVRSYLDQAIVLAPMATVNYVVEKEDTSGGPGANFIIQLNSDNPQIKPLIQAVMVGSTSNKAFSFTTNGYLID